MALVMAMMALSWLSATGMVKLDLPSTMLA